MKYDLRDLARKDYEEDLNVDPKACTKRDLIFTFLFLSMSIGLVCLLIYFMRTII